MATNVALVYDAELIWEHNSHISVGGSLVRRVGTSTLDLQVNLQDQFRSPAA